MMFDKYKEIVHKAGMMLLEADAVRIKEKSDFRNLVTSYDLKVQDYLMGEFSRFKPRAGYLCEEETDRDVSGTKGVFIIDPIDGTANFVHGYNLSAVSVAYAENDELQWGIVYNPFTDEIFEAERGKGARLNGSPVKVSSGGLRQNMVAFGTSPYNTDKKRETLSLVSEVMKHSMDVRRLGSAALDLCYVAAGRAGLYFEMELSPWDYAAGMLIVREAGGIVMDMEYSEVAFTDKSSMCAGNSKCIEEFKMILKGEVNNE